MLRGPVSLLARLAQRAPLTQVALPLLVAFAPEAFRFSSACARSLHVFARLPNTDFAKIEVCDDADVGDLKKAVIAELQLDTPPHRVRLLREVEGGAHMPLDSRRALAEQEVREGTSVLIEVQPPPPPPLPPALPYVLVRQGGSLNPSKVVFARGADAYDLVKAVIAELKLDAAPGRVRLLREVEGGGAPVPLDSHRALAEQGVREGTSVLIEVQPPPPPPLPPPLHLGEEMLGGERFVVANLQGSPGIEVPHPFFLTQLQHANLEYFLQRAPPFDTPSMLMLSGTIKSGKTRILTSIIPRLLSLYYERAPAAAGHRRRPIIFHHSFTLGIPAERAAETLLASLHSFASEQGIVLPMSAGAASDHLPRAAEALAEGIHHAGNKLWLLFDELGAPIVASSELEAVRFVQLFKDMLNATHTRAGTVATGSGMVALLKAVAEARVNGFCLWNAALHLRVGQEPAPAVVLAMAQRLHSAYAPSWHPSVRAFVTPQLLVDSLAFEAHAGLTSPRPALLAFLAGSLCSSCWTVPDGSGEQALQIGTESVLGKLEAESRGDAALGLERMLPSELKELRLLAEHGVLPKDFRLARFAAVLCEEQVVPKGPGGEAQEGQQQLLAPPAAMKLLPPYGHLLQRWITQDGWLSITSRERGQPLVPRVMKTLTTVNECWRHFDEDLNVSLTDSVLQTLAENGIGVSVPREAPRPPRTVAELVGVPVFALIVTELEQAAAAAPGGKPSQTAKIFRNAASAEKEAQGKFMAHSGRNILLLLRNYLMHVPTSTAKAQAIGLTEAALDSVVRAAAQEILSCSRNGHLYTFDDHGALLLRKP
jgi:hypothetical protein